MESWLCCSQFGSFFRPKVFLVFEEQFLYSHKNLYSPFLIHFLFSSFEKYLFFPIETLFHSLVESELKCPKKWYLNVRAQFRKGHEGTQSTFYYWTLYPVRFGSFRKINNSKLAKPGVHFGTVT